MQDWKEEMNVIKDSGALDITEEFKDMSYLKTNGEVFTIVPTEALINKAKLERYVSDDNDVFSAMSLRAYGKTMSDATIKESVDDIITVTLNGAKVEISTEELDGIQTMLDKKNHIFKINVFFKGLQHTEHLRYSVVYKAENELSARFVGAFVEGLRNYITEPEVQVDVGGFLEDENDYSFDSPFVLTEFTRIADRAGKDRIVFRANTGKIAYPDNVVEDKFYFDNIEIGDSIDGVVTHDKGTYCFMLGCMDDISLVSFIQSIPRLTMDDIKSLPKAGSVLLSSIRKNFNLDGIEVTLPNLVLVKEQVYAREEFPENSTMPDKVTALSALYDDLAFLDVPDEDDPRDLEVKEMLVDLLEDGERYLCQYYQDLVNISKVKGALELTTLGEHAAINNVKYSNISNVDELINIY